MALQIETGHLDKVDLPDDYILEEAIRITEEASKRNILVRLIGSTAFVVHCPAHRELFKTLKRRLPDVDLMAYSSVKQSSLDELFKALDYEPIKSLAWHATGRNIYVNKEKLYVDVFKDILSFCHEITFKGRLDLDNPTITLVDLMLEKLQVVEINEKDFKDMAVLLLEHDFGSGDPEKVDYDYLAGLWAKDWGFYYTGTTNLKKLQSYIGSNEVLSKEQVKTVHDKVNTLLRRVEDEPKSLRWKMRAKIGTKVRWYEKVESVER